MRQARLRSIPGMSYSISLAPLEARHIGQLEADRQMTTVLQETPMIYSSSNASLQRTLWSQFWALKATKLETLNSPKRRPRPRKDSNVYSRVWSQKRRPILQGRLNPNQSYWPNQRTEHMQICTPGSWQKEAKTNKSKLINSRKVPIGIFLQAMVG